MLADLLAWYRRNRRDLPWRRAPDPWRVLVAETMLQQTRVAAVLPRYEDFLARFPDPLAMAEAGEDAVLASWSGLGYYGRGRRLYAAAREIVASHDGRVPDDRKALLSLPGLGDYTAGAVLSIAFGRREPVVDGNVERVLSRIHLIRGNVKRLPAKRVIRDRASALVEKDPPGEVNQALMELGALVCLPRSPRCPDCPVAADCAARASNVQEELPELPPRPATVDLPLAVALVKVGERLLLVRARPGELLASTWTPPLAPVGTEDEPRAVLRRRARLHYGLRLDPAERVGEVRHTITHHRIRAECFRAETGPVPDREDVRLVHRDDLAGHAISSLASKALRLLRWDSPADRVNP